MIDTRLESGRGVGSRMHRPELRRCRLADVNCRTRNLRHAMRSPVAGSNRLILRVSTANRAVSPRRWRRSGDTRPSARSSPRRSTTMVSAPVGSIISTGAAMVRAASGASLKCRVGSAMHSGRMPSTTSRPIQLSALRGYREPDRRLTLSDCRHSPAGGRLQAGGKRVHRRRTHEPGDEEIGRTVVDRLRVGELLHHALPHDRDAGGKRHGLDLVVGDIHDR